MSGRLRFPFLSLPPENLQLETKIAGKQPAPLGYGLGGVISIYILRTTRTRGFDQLGPCVGTSSKLVSKLVTFVHFVHPVN